MGDARARPIRRRAQEAAALLGVSFRSLRYRLQKLGIDKAEDKDDKDEGAAETRRGEAVSSSALMPVVALAIAAVAFVGAQVRARGRRRDPGRRRASRTRPRPISAPPIVSLGFREVARRSACGSG